MANLENARRRSKKESMDTPVKKERRLERWLTAVIAVLVLAIWEWSARTGGISNLFFPAPTIILSTLFHLLANGVMLTNAGATLTRLLCGFVLGGVPGLLLGLAMGWSRRLRAIIDPFIAAAHPVPKIAILPLIMIIFGIGETSKVVIIAITTFFPMLINTMAGVRQISPTYFEVAENYGANLYQLFTRVVFPGSLPLILTGIRLSLNIALLLTIAVELVSSHDGLGDMIWFAWETLRTEELYATLVVIAVMGIGFNLLLQFITGRMAPWHVERQVS